MSSDFIRWLIKPEGTIEQIKRIIADAQKQAGLEGGHPDDAMDFIISVIAQQYNNKLRMVSALEQIKFNALIQNHEAMTRQMQAKKPE